MSTTIEIKNVVYRYSEYSLFISETDKPLNFDPNSTHWDAQKQRKPCFI